MPPPVSGLDSTTFIAIVSGVILTRLPQMRLGTSALRGLLVGTVVSTLLLAVQGGSNPSREAAWVLIRATLTAFTDGYGSHVAIHGDLSAAGYAAALARNIAHEWAIVVASLPTVV